MYVIVFLGLAALLPAGPLSASAAEPTGRLVFGAAAAPESIDPAMIIGLQSWNIVRNVFDSLVARDFKTFGYKPGLAESYRMLNDTTWQFTLRRGVRFHNGEEFDAEAVKFSVERVLDPEQKSTSRGQNLLIDRVVILDRYTINIITKRPMPMLLERFTSPGYTGTIPIVPPRYVREKGDQHFAANPVGTGAYRVVKWVKGDFVELEANKDYWGGAPKVKTVIVKTIPEATTRVSALLTGEADIIDAVPPDLIDMIKADPRVRISETEVDGVPTDLEFNTTRSAPLADARVRWALSHAIDMDLVVKNLMRGHGARRPVPLDPRAFGYNPNLPLQTYDLEKAKRLLAEAGYPEGKGIPELVILHRRGGGGTLLAADAHVEYVMSQFAKLGVRVRLDAVEEGTMIMRSRDRKLWDFRVASWGGGGRFEVGDTLFFEYHSGAPTSGLFNKEFDQVLDRARETMDPEARKQLYWKAQELVYNLAASLPAVQNNIIWGVRNDVIWSAPLGQMVLFIEVERKK
jgi:peptide/nickel transport system substrate-binding protein